MRLSQYIGEFHPEAQVKGLFGCNFIALICNRNSAVFFAVSLFKIMQQMYRIFINDGVLILRSFESILEVDEQFQIQSYSYASCMKKAISKKQNGISNSIIFA